MSDLSHQYLQALMNRLDDAILIVDSERVVQLQNVAASKLLKSRNGLSVRKGQLTLPMADDNRRMEELLYEGSSRKQEIRGIRINSAGRHRDWLMLVSMLPLTSDMQSAFMIQLIRRVHVRHIPVNVIQDLYELTRGECVVAEQLMSGKSIREISHTLGKSTETIRAYVKRIFHKLDIHSQSELVSLAHRITCVANGHSDP